MCLVRSVPALLFLLSLLAWPATGFALAEAAGGTLHVLAWPGYADAEVVRDFEQRHGLANTITESRRGGAGERLLWLEPMEDPPRRDKLWARIVSGDRAAKVLAP